MSIEDRVFVSTSCVTGDRHISTVLDRLAKLDILNVELSGPHPYVPYEILVEVLLRYKNSGMSFILHNYFPPPSSDFVLNIASHDQQIINKNYALIHNAVDLTKKTEALFYGCHAGYLADAIPNDGGYFKFDDASIRLPESCLEQAVGTINRILEVEIKMLSSALLLIENLFPVDHLKTLSLACTPSEIRKLFSMVDNPKLGFLLDLAHLELTCITNGVHPNEALDEVMDDLGERIREVHLSGHDGKTDAHLPLEPDCWQLLAARRLNALHGNGNGVMFTLESRRMSDDILLSQRDMILESLEKKL